MEEQGEQDATGWTGMARRERSCRSGEIRDRRIAGSDENNVVFLTWLITCFVVPEIKITHTKYTIYDPDKSLIVSRLSKLFHLTEEPQIRRLEITKKRVRTIRDCNTRP